MLDTGEVGSIAELVRKYDVDRSYVGRMLKLTSLAPDLVDDILAGREPEGLALRGLPKLLPVLWTKQQVLSGHQTTSAV